MTGAITILGSLVVAATVAFSLGSIAATFNDLVLFDQASAPQAFTLSTRAVPTSLPVPSFRPHVVNTPLAFDLMPNGTPAEFGNNGYTWMDVCDTDLLLGTGTMPVTCGRVGIRSDRVEVGTRTFDGGTAKKLSLSINGTGIIEIAPSGQVTITSLVVAADNTAAAAAGVPVNGLYRTATGELRVRI